MCFACFFLAAWLYGFLGNPGTSSRPIGFVCFALRFPPILFRRVCWGLVLRYLSCALRRAWEYGPPGRSSFLFCVSLSHYRGKDLPLYMLRSDLLECCCLLLRCMFSCFRFFIAFHVLASWSYWWPIEHTWHDFRDWWWWGWFSDGDGKEQMYTFWHCGNRGQLGRIFMLGSNSRKGDKFRGNLLRCE